MKREEKKERMREAEGLNPPGISVSKLPAQALAGRYASSTVELPTGNGHWMFGAGGGFWLLDLSVWAKSTTGSQTSLALGNIHGPLTAIGTVGMGLHRPSLLAFLHTCIEIYFPKALIAMNSSTSSASKRITSDVTPQPRSLAHSTIA